MILTLYIAKRFVGMFARVFAIFFGIMMLIETIDQLRRYSGTTLGLGDAVYMAALSVPESLYRILPLIVILASITLFLGLARSSELVVVRAAGRSGLRFLAAPVVAALVIGALAVAVFNPLVAATSKQYGTLSAVYGANGGSVMSVSGSGLWMRQGDASGQSVIKAARAGPGGGVVARGDVPDVSARWHARPTYRGKVGLAAAGAMGADRGETVEPCIWQPRARRNPVARWGDTADKSDHGTDHRQLWRCNGCGVLEPSRLYQ